MSGLVFPDMKKFYFYAWKRLVVTYLLTAGGCFFIGRALLESGIISAESLFELSTKRISSVAAFFSVGGERGIDPGIIIFFWNLGGAYLSISLLFFALLFNPEKKGDSPRWLRAVFCGNHRMKMLCYLPGCRNYSEESLRRLYVWLMIPFLGMMLLGVESGFMLATSGEGLVPFLRSIFHFIPHGLIEIPAFAMAGAVTYSGHLLLKKTMADSDERAVFLAVKEYVSSFPLMSLCFSIAVLLFFAAMIEAHLTHKIVALIF